MASVNVPYLFYSVSLMDIVMNVLLGPVHPWLWDIDLR